MSARAAWHRQALHADAAAGDDEGHAEDAFEDEDAEHASGQQQRASGPQGTGVHLVQSCMTATSQST